MKAIIQSIHPKYCELIANGKKTIELKPCPFCGCSDAGTKWHHGYWSVACGYNHDSTPSTHCFQDWGEFETEEQAMEAWNTRKPGVKNNGN